MPIFRKNGNPIIDSNRCVGSQELGIGFELPRDPLCQRLGTGLLGLRKKDAKLIAAKPKRI